MMRKEGDTKRWALFALTGLLCFRYLEDTLQAKPLTFDQGGILALPVTSSYPLAEPSQIQHGSETLSGHERLVDVLVSRKGTFVFAILHYGHPYRLIHLNS